MPLLERAQEKQGFGAVSLPSPVQRSARLVAYFLTAHNLVWGPVKWSQHDAHLTASLLPDVGLPNRPRGRHHSPGPIRSRRSSSPRGTQHTLGSQAALSQPPTSWYPRHGRQGERGGREPVQVRREASCGWTVRGAGKPGKAWGSGASSTLDAAAGQAPEDT